MADKRLPDVFIGCSSESLDAAKAVQNNLQQVARIRIWTEEIDRPGRVVIQEIVEAAKETDFAIFILSPDDTTTSRQQQFLSPQDNTIFEAGLFMGVLGVERVFILKPKNSNIKSPSDLLGITSALYDIPEDNRWEVALGPASNKIAAELRSQGKKDQISFGPLSGSVAKRKQFVDFFGQSATKQDFKLVFSKRELNDSAAVFRYPFARQLLFPRLDATDFASVPVPKEVRAWLAYDDMLVATKLSKLFGTACNQQVQVSLDIDDETWTKGPTIAVGLGFTWHTQQLLRAGNLDKKVQVTWVNGPPVSDAFVFDTVQYSAGGKDYDFAIVARVVCEGGHVHFICAGRTAPGTAAAGRYLAEKWEEMANLYESRDPETTSLGVLIRHPRTFHDVCSVGLDRISIVAHVFDRDIGS
jgi:hypothetical protein